MSSWSDTDRRVNLGDQVPQPKSGLPAGELGIEECIEQLTRELHERVDHQRELFRRVLGTGERASECSAYCPMVDCPRLSTLKAALLETITVLEETRGSFKSRRLEVIRRKLTDILSAG